MQLIGGLAGEKVRWSETVQELDYMVNNVSGDVLLAAGYVAYLGPFTVSGSSLPPLSISAGGRMAFLRN